MRLASQLWLLRATARLLMQALRHICAGVFSGFGAQGQAAARYAAAELPARLLADKRMRTNNVGRQLKVCSVTKLRATMLPLLTVHTL